MVEQELAMTAVNRRRERLTIINRMRGGK